MKTNRCFTYILVTVLLMAGAAMPQALTNQAKKTQSPTSTDSRVAAGPSVAATSTQVTGSGTEGQLVKWTGGNASSIVGNSIITESKLGNIGIGTLTPGSRLSVEGMIETTLGGYKFPDGTVQTTAFSGKVAHDGTLKGDGSAGSPLGLANPLDFSGNLTVRGTIETTQGGYKFPDGTIQTTASPGFVKHDGTLQGDGSVNALGVAVPLILSDAVDADSRLGVITATNFLPGEATAFLGLGGPSQGTTSGGTGLTGFGGVASTTGEGGTGVVGIGGIAIEGIDGAASGKNGGHGAVFRGGDAGKASGGIGAIVEGGQGSGDGNKGGRGLFVAGGDGRDGATDGLAAEFQGDVAISGNLSKGGGSFKIDHPLDPENKYLYHSFVESPDMMNIYNGTTTTDANGDAGVTLPDWFEALNQDFRYQLTVIGTFAQAIVAEEIKGNRFMVKTSAPNIKVSWQVTGIRHDAYANKHRIPVEEQKPQDEQGLFLHPDAFNKSKDMGVQFVRSAAKSK